MITTKIKRNNTEEGCENEDSPSETLSKEIRQLDFRAQAAEEIRSAREINRIELMELAEKRNDVREKRKIEEAETLYIDRDTSYQTSSTGSVNSLDWVDGLSYVDPFSASRDMLHDIKLEPNSMSADIAALKHATDDLARAITAYDVQWIQIIFISPADTHFLHAT